MSQGGAWGLRSAPGATRGVPWPRFTSSWIYTYAINQAGTSRAQEAGSRRSADQRRQRRPMPCCSSPLPSPVRANGPVLARPTKRDAAPDRLCIDDARALLVGEFPHDSPPAPGVLFCLFPLFCLHLLPSLCSKQSREARPYDFRCNAFCLKESRWNKSLCF